MILCWATFTAILGYMPPTSNRLDTPGARSLWDTFKRSNICIIEVPKGDEKGQEIGNLFEKIMKENFPNLVD